VPTTVRGILLRLAAATAFLPAPVIAQSHSPAVAPLALDVLAGSELENYLRALQVAGLVQPYPWSIRSFSAREISKLLQTDSGTGAWRVSAQRLGNGIAPGGVYLRTTFNSAYPYGANDGAPWSGRGFTVSASAGFAAKLGPLSIAIAPVAFASENRRFPLLENGESGLLAFNDGLFPRSVDRPQRFGNEAYRRVDPGASGVRLDFRFATLGAGTFPMWWGPATEHPFVVGNNAAGIPHLFVGTGEPLNIGIGRLHARAVWGMLQQSAYSPVTGSDRYLSDSAPGRDRLMAGAVFTFVPRPFPGLEVGITHFAHVPYLPGRPGSFFWRSAWPEVLFFKKTLYDNAADSTLAENKNQLGSIFFRWVFPRTGFELYGEHGRDDWSWDFRDLVQEPDHNKAYMVGFQKTIRNRAAGLSLLRGELMNFELSRLARDRPGQGAIYTHFVMRQGHTHRGQLIGSGAGVGSAAGSVLAWDRYTPRTRSTVVWRRIIRAQRGNYAETGIDDPHGDDVLHSLGYEHARTWRQFRATAGIELMHELNRNFRNDAGNLNLVLMLSWLPRVAAGPSLR
jgi:hypothetical protein